jgi:hypothetical protein
MPEARRDQLLGVVESVAESVAAMEALHRETFGHGAFGWGCRFCGGSDYSTPTVQHTDSCPWVAARAILANPSDPPEPTPETP